VWTALALVMGVLAIAVWLFALVDVWRRGDLSSAAKWAWTLIIVLLPFLGTVLYLIIGFFLRDALAEE
jgi:Phospholipase_D-nuclease N-terminal